MRRNSISLFVKSSRGSLGIWNWSKNMFWVNFWKSGSGLLRYLIISIPTRSLRAPGKILKSVVWSISGTWRIYRIIFARRSEPRSEEESLLRVFHRMDIRKTPKIRTSILSILKQPLLWSVCFKCILKGMVLKQLQRRSMPKGFQTGIHIKKGSQTCKEVTKQIWLIGGGAQRLPVCWRMSVILELWFRGATRKHPINRKSCCADRRANGSKSRIVTSLSSIWTHGMQYKNSEK